MTDDVKNESNEYQHWRLEREADKLAWLCFDKADGSANVLSASVLQELDDILEALRSDRPSGLVIHSGKSNGFIMGADINEFTHIDDPDTAYELGLQGQHVINSIADLGFPSVAVINGFALGGGLELAMACDYRVAINQPKPVIGLPEVQLGLHPGFGGTVRAVQICGVRPAMELMLTGKSITVSKAHKWGLVDEICGEDDWKSAAEKILASGQAKASAPFVDKLMNLGIVRPLMANILRKQVRRKARPDHYPAPYAIIDLWQKHGAADKSGYDAEVRSFANLMVGPTSRNLVRVFFLQNKLKSQGNKTEQRIRNVHVVGAGVMGGDIAAWCALRGLNVSLQDRAEEYIQPAMERAGKLFDKKTYNEADRQAANDRLVSDVAGEHVADADLVIEAIFENLEAKQELYKDLQSKMKPGAILATNTSSIRLEELRSVLEAPTRFIGLHFFNPVAQMPLVELIRCADTEEAVTDVAFSFIKRISKLGLGCKSAPGFVVNRVLAPYMVEATYLAEEGIPLPVIDEVAEKFGMPMGPVELADTVGIDVALNVSKVLGGAFDRPVPQKLQEMVDQKQLGRKSGKGFYAWKDGKAVKPEVTGGPWPENIADRLMLPLVNEAVACFNDGVVEDPDLLDAGIIFGTGFAPFRGGPLQYARNRGIDEIQDILNMFAEQHGDRYKPGAGWQKLG